MSETTELEHLKELFNAEIASTKAALEHKVVCLQELADERIKTQKELLDSKSADRKQLMDAQLNGLRTEMETKTAAAAELANERLTDVENARQLAAVEIDRRLVGMNEFRDQIREERSGFLATDVYERDSREQQRRTTALELGAAAAVTRPLHDKLENDMDERLKLLENAKANAEGKMWRIGSTVSFGISILTMIGYLLIAYINRSK